MAKQTINTLRQWFRTGIKPTQQQFWDWLDSFWHKDDKIPITSLDGLQTELDKKADKDSLQNGVTPPVGDNGNWYYGIVDSGKKATGIDGKSDYQLAVDSGYVGTLAQWLLSLKGTNGISPTIGANGNWFIGTTDTGIKATGVNGRGISSIARTFGSGAAGSTDTYTITFTDNSSTAFTVVNGTNGYTPQKGVDYS